MKYENNKLILSPLGELSLETYTKEDGSSRFDLLWKVQSSCANHIVTLRANESDLTPTDLDRLAEQLELASVQVRTILADLDPGRRFEAIQAQQFQAGRLEGDL
jgi:hypothetical protein